MAIFNSYVTNYQRVAIPTQEFPPTPKATAQWHTKWCAKIVSSANSFVIDAKRKNGGCSAHEKIGQIGPNNISLWKVVTDDFLVLLNGFSRIERFGEKSCLMLLLVINAYASQNDGLIPLKSVNSQSL